MSGGLIQLVAKGVQDIFLTEDPQITFFKIVYRRHTNFSIEHIAQRFNKDPNFGERVSATISRAGDMCGRVFIVLELPSLSKLDGDINRFRWVDYIGYSIINNVEIEIGGKLMDKHYGEWMFIWHELTRRRDAALNNMVGNLSSLTDLDQTKESFKLYIPLEFWFCRNNGLALPLVNLMYSEVRINLELNEAKKCYVGSPTHYIELEDNLVGYEKGEIIKQDLENGTIAYGQFVYFDKNTKRLYYNKLSNVDSPFVSISTTNKNLTTNERLSLARNETNKKYRIIGLTTEFESMPKINGSEKKNIFPRLKNFNILDCYLLVTYMFLDEEEREKFALSKHEYLIEQVQYSGNRTLESLGTKVNLNFENPTKEIVWVVQFSNFNTRKDYYNYTDSPDIKTGESIINRQTVSINGNERVSMRDAFYFDTVNKYQHHSFSTVKGINVYSFCLHPELHQPSGPINMSQISNLSINMELKPSVNPSNTANLRCYVVSYNILRVANGISGLVFNKE